LARLGASAKEMGSTFVTIQARLLLHVALAEPLLAASSGQGGIPFLRNLTYSGARASFLHFTHKKKKKPEIRV